MKGRRFGASPRKEEVNLVIRRGGKPLPIEVKYWNHADIGPSKGLPKFMCRQKVLLEIAVTKDMFEERTVDGQRILLVPAWLFLWVA
jgi:hypothetical protein